LLNECIDLATTQEELDKTVDLAEQIHHATVEKKLKDKDLMQDLNMSELRQKISDTIELEIRSVKKRIKAEVSKMNLKGSIVSIEAEFDGEDEITTKSENEIKTWKNQSGSMKQLLCKQLIKSGVHEMQVKSISDNGGFTVIGITDDKQTDYYNCIGMAGNSFTTNHKVKKIGTWSGKMQWGKNDLLSFKVDTQSLL